MSSALTLRLIIEWSFKNMFHHKCFIINTICQIICKISGQFELVSRVNTSTVEDTSDSNSNENWYQFRFKVSKTQLSQKSGRWFWSSFYLFWNPNINVVVWLYRWMPSFPCDFFCLLCLCVKPLQVVCLMLAFPYLLLTTASVLNSMKHIYTL